MAAAVWIRHRSTNSYFSVEVYIIASRHNLDGCQLGNSWCYWQMGSVRVHVSSSATLELSTGGGGAIKYCMNYFVTRWLAKMSYGLFLG